MTAVHQVTEATPHRRFGNSRPPNKWAKILVTAHVLTAVGLFGLDLALVAMGVAGARGAEPSEIYPAMHLLVRWLMLPLALAALGTGLLLARLGGWRLFRFAWVAIKLLITLGLTVVLFLILAPGLAAAATMDALSESQRRLLALAPAASSILLGVNVGLGVYKSPKALRIFGRSSRGRP